MRSAAAPSLLLFALVACGGGDGKSADSGPGPADEGPLQYAPVAQWDSYNFEGFAVRQYIPPNPRGVVFFFHGTNGNVTIVNQIEPVAFLNELIVEGVGFVSTDSTDRATGKWLDGDDARVGRLYQQVIADTELEASDALFTAGFSGGGNMAGTFADYAQGQGWPIKAINANQSGCLPCSGDIPAIWVLNENDTNPHGTAESIHADLKAENVRTRILWVDEQRIDETSFTKHPDMTAERAQRVYEDLVAKELIDAGGARLVPDDEADNWCNWYATNGESFGPEGRAEELRVLWALHRFSAEHARTVRDFFLDEL